MTIIEAIELRTILDSRGNPTVEAEISTAGGFGRSAAPSGASTGAAEAKVLPPREAIDNAIQNLIPALIGMDAADQECFDAQLRDIDGTADFSGIGANVAVALSLANAKAAASALGLPLFRYLGGAFVNEMPLPLGNVIGGGAHAANATEIQEFLIVPGGAADVEEAVFANAAVHKTVKDLLKKKGIAAGKGDEGAWAPQIDDALAFELIAEATGRVADEMNVSVDMGIDVASSQMWNGTGYKYRDRVRSTEDQIAYIAEIVDKYNLVYVEDPLHEDDFDAFAELNRQVGDRCLVCGDDLFVTQVDRIEKGIETGSANCVLIKRHFRGHSPCSCPWSGHGDESPVRRDHGYHHYTPRHCVFLRILKMRSGGRRTHCQIKRTHSHRGTIMTPVNEMEIELKEPLVPVEEYLAAGIHIGTQQKSEDMKKFIYRVRGDGLYILDIRETDARIKTVAKFLNQYEAPDVLVVTSRQYGQYPAKKFADTIGAMSATGRFIPGLLTNPVLDGYIEPKVIVVTDPIGDEHVINEAVQCGIPVVALCDTNNMTRFVDLVIPTNNKGRKALSMVYFLMSREMLRLRGISTALTLEDFESEI
jgi:enolase